MINFYQFLESQPVRIKLTTGWEKNQETTNEPDITPTEFIDEFINIVNATKNVFAQNYIYEDQESLVKFKIKPYGNYIYVSELIIQPKNASVTFRFMSELTKLADQHSMTLRCISSPIKTHNQEEVDIKRLTSLYKRYGFISDPNSEDQYDLIRKPKKHDD